MKYKLPLDRQKLTLSHTPTPLQFLPRLSEHTGVDVWMKRDDLTEGMGTGGNKVRKLEYILADALAKGAKTVVTTGGPQSNHAKTTAALAVKAGLTPVLVLAGKEPGHRRTHLFLNELLGAEMHFSKAYTPQQIEQALQDTYRKLDGQGRKPYLIPIGGSSGLGTLGYLDAYTELESQLKSADQDLCFEWIVVTAGSGGTYAGLFIGQEQAGGRARLLGVSAWLSASDIRKRILHCMHEVLPDWADKPLAERIRVDDRYIGPGYGKLTRPAQEAIQLVARTEAILLDHVYTGKTMAAVIDYIARGVIRPGERVLFWHTGGASGLFDVQERWFSSRNMENKSE
jgi:D-cysteine desulfhydrase family pyridoxal phosphate-dependent enzyme